MPEGGDYKTHLVPRKVCRQHVIDFIHAACPGRRQKGQDKDLKKCRMQAAMHHHGCQPHLLDI